MFMIRVAMGAVNLKIVPEASVFRGDAYYDGPGAQKYHFWRKRPFWIFFLKYFLEKYFSGHIFPKKTQKSFFGKIGLVATLVLGGRARKITPLIYPLIFENVFGHEIGRRGIYWIKSEKISVDFKGDADFEVKSAVASYFGGIFIFGGVKFCFWVHPNKCETPILGSKRSHLDAFV